MIQWNPSKNLVSSVSLALLATTLALACYLHVSSGELISCTSNKVNIQVVWTLVCGKSDAHPVLMNHRHFSSFQFSTHSLYPMGSKWRLAGEIQ
jgi:hypothetical protein